MKSTRAEPILIVALVLMGAAWGLTIPLTKFAIESGFRDFGIIFWQFALGAVLLGGILTVLGRPLRIARIHWPFCLLIALLGTFLPNWASNTAAIHLPAGIMSIVISTVPLIAWPIAMGLGMDRFSALRALGLMLGFGAILLIALPEASLPDASMAAWLPLALVAPALYAVEGNYVAKRGTGGLDPIQVLFGASIIGTIISAPVAVLSGVWIAPRPPFELAHGAVIASACLHALAYSGYVWLVGRGGSVFAAQVAYLVTGFGIVWASLLLDESYSSWVWAALVFMFVGLFLVQPRGRSDQTQVKEGIAAEPALGEI
ncbi:MAG: DMT family transporter [Pseudomonadota bacterium]